jgi:hypothetical protein
MLFGRTLSASGDGNDLGSAAVGFPPFVQAARASADTTPIPRRTRFIVMTPVCRVQRAFDTRRRHVHAKYLNVGWGDRIRMAL